MENQPLDNHTSNLQVSESESKSQIFWIILLFVLSVSSSFAGGYYLRNINGNIPVASNSPSPSASSIAIETKAEDPIVGIPGVEGKEYSDDTFMGVTDETPRKILIATASRQETDQGANQATRVSYFDGNEWTRKTMTSHQDSAAIFTNKLISKWNIEIDPSRVLKQSVIGTIQVDQNSIDFDTGIITNNIVMRSLPGYTKFISNNTGNLTINGSREKAKIVYTRIYSNDSSQMQFYETPFGLTTNWLAFWDTNGNFYHIDKTIVDQPTDKYQTHEVGVKVDKLGSVTKTFDVSIDYDNENPPSSYNIKLGAPINQQLTIKIGKSINKAPSNAFKWFMSECSGLVDGETSGYGAIEYIHN